MERRLPSLLFFLIAASAFASCSAIRPSNSNTTAYNRNTSASPRFVDGIEISPGFSKHELNNIEKEIKHTEKIEARQRSSTYLSGKTENITGLQAKYCVILNIPIEDMQNDGKLLQEVEEWWGTPYQMGGNSKSGIDCSAFCQVFLQDLYAAYIPRTAQQQYDNSMHPQPGEQLHKGDLVFFGSSEHNITHVGVYITNNKFVHASTSRGVMISDLNDNYWGKKFIGSGRYYANLTANNN